MGQKVNRKKRIVGSRISREAYDILSDRADKSKVSFYEYTSAILEMEARSTIKLEGHVQEATHDTTSLTREDMIKVYKTSHSTNRDETTTDILE